MKKVPDKIYRFNKVSICTGLLDLVDVVESLKDKSLLLCTVNYLYDFLPDDIEFFQEDFNKNEKK